MQTCQVCGKQNPQGVEYCDDCGAALKAAAPSPDPAQTAQTGRLDAPAQAAPDSGTTSPDTTPAQAGDGAAPAPATGAVPTSLTDTGAAPTPTPAPAATPAPMTDEAPVAGPPGGNPRLAVKRFGALTGDEVPLLGERLVVGRFDPETGPVDIDLSAAPEAEHISRQHGELYHEEGGRWFVRDLGSSNGVFVKGGADASFGPRISAPRELTDGDEVAFGNARFVFRRG